MTKIHGYCPIHKNYRPVILFGSILGNCLPVWAAETITLGNFSLGKYSL